MFKKLVIGLKMSLILSSFAFALSANAILPPAVLDVFTIDDLVIAPKDTSGSPSIATSTEIDLRFSGPVAVSLDILDSTNALVKHIYDDSSVTNPTKKPWAGKDSGDNFVIDGPYTVQVVYTSSGETATSTKTITVDNDVPTVGAITIVPSQVVGTTTYIGTSSDLSVDVSDAGTGIRDCEFGYDNGAVNYWGITNSCTLDDVDTSDQTITKIVVQAYDNFLHSQSADQVVSVDATAPVTTISAESDSAPYAFGTPTTKSVIITLNSVDGESGLDKIYYSIDDGANYAVYSGPLTLTDPGTYSVKVYGVDFVGNEEVVQSQVVEIESSPVVTMASPSSSSAGGTGYIAGWGPNGPVNPTLGQVLGTSTEKISRAKAKSELTPQERRLRVLKRRANRLAIKIYHLKHPQASQVLGGTAQVPTTADVVPVGDGEVQSTSTASSSPARKPFWKFW